MFKNLFGGSKKDDHKPVQTAQPTAKDQDFAKQEKLVSIKRAVEESRNNVEKFYEKLTKKEVQIKSLLATGKRDEARRHLTLFKVMKDQIVNLENLCTTLEKELIRLEVNMQSATLVVALQQANELQKDQDKLRDNLENIVMDLKEKEAQENEIKNLLSELSTGTEEENEDIDRMMNEMEQDVHDQKAQQIMDIPVKQQPGLIKPQPAVSISAVSSQVSQKDTDDLDDLLMQTQ